MSVLPDSVKEEALKEGVDVDSTQEKDVAVKPASESSPEVKDGTTPDGGAKPAAIETKPEETPFHKHPRFQELARENREMKEKMARIESMYTEKLESLVGMMTPKQESSLSDQDKQALVQLFKAGAQVPEIAEMLGLNRAQSLEKALESERQTRLDREFDSEFDSVVNKWSSTYGLKADEMRQELLEYMQSSDFYGKKSYSPGLIAEAAKSLYFERISELKTREANLELIRQQNEKKKSGTEAPSKGKPNQAANLPKNMSDHLHDLVKAGGGEIDFD